MGVTHVSYQDDFDFRTASNQTRLTNLSTSLSFFLLLVIPLIAVCHQWEKGIIFPSMVICKCSSYVAAQTVINSEVS